MYFIASAPLWTPVDAEMSIFIFWALAIDIHLITSRISFSVLNTEAGMTSIWSMSISGSKEPVEQHHSLNFPVVELVNYIEDI